MNGKGFRQTAAQKREAEARRAAEFDDRQRVLAALSFEEWLDVSGFRNAEGEFLDDLRDDYARLVSTYAA